MHITARESAMPVVQGNTRLLPNAWVTENGSSRIPIGTYIWMNSVQSLTGSHDNFPDHSEALPASGRTSGRLTSQHVTDSLLSHRISTGYTPSTRCPIWDEKAGLTVLTPDLFSHTSTPSVVNPCNHHTRLRLRYQQLSQEFSGAREN